MAESSQPDKQLVRDWLKQQVEARRPPPSTEEIRRQLGWHLNEAEREAIKRKIVIHGTG